MMNGDFPRMLQHTLIGLPSSLRTPAIPEFIHRLCGGSTFYSFWQFLKVAWLWVDGCEFHPPSLPFPSPLPPSPGHAPLSGTHSGGGGAHSIFHSILPPVRCTPLGIFGKMDDRVGEGECYALPISISNMAPLIYPYPACSPNCFAPTSPFQGDVSPPHCPRTCIRTPPNPTHPIHLDSRADAPASAGPIVHYYYLQRSGAAYPCVVS